MSTATMLETPRHCDPSVSRDERISAVGFDYDAQDKQGVDCNLCGQSTWRTIAVRDRCGYAARTCLCRTCGLVQLNPRMTKAAYSRFYAGDYRKIVSACNGELVDANTIQKCQAEYAGLLLQVLAPHLTGREGQSLLDIGGSTGVHAGALCGAFGLCGEVIDPSESELSKARQRGLGTIYGLIEDLSFGGPDEYDNAEGWDVITCIQTIDHLLDISGTIDKVRSILKPGGLFIFDIVDFEYMRKAFGVENSAKIDHPFYLTIETAAAFARKSHLEIILRAEAGRHQLFVCRAAQSPVSEERKRPRQDYINHMLADLPEVSDG